MALNTADLTPCPRDVTWQIPACVLQGMGHLWGYQVTFDHQTLEPFLPARVWITARPAWWLGKWLRREGTEQRPCPGVFLGQAAVCPRHRRARTRVSTWGRPARSGEGLSASHGEGVWLRRECPDPGFISQAASELRAGPRGTLCGHCGGVTASQSECTCLFSF